MSEINKSRESHVILSVLLGMVSFLISGVIAGIVIQRLDNYILATIIAGGIGGLLTGIFLGMGNRTFRMALAGLIGMPIALLGSFLLIEVLGALMMAMGLNFEDSPLPDISVAVLMGIVFGAVVASMIYGRKSVPLFALVGGIVSMPFGWLITAMNSGSIETDPLENLFGVFGRIDLNFLAMAVSLGIGIGLSIGLYHRVNERRMPGSA